MSDVFEQWKGKQAVMGRRVPDTFAPYSPPKLPECTCLPNNYEDTAHLDTEESCPRHGKK